jgi:hypothetical protein
MEQISMSDSNKGAHEFALAFARSAQMDDLQSYLQRGRLFERNTNEELIEVYPEAFKLFVKGLRRLERRGSA